VLQVNNDVSGSAFMFVLCILIGFWHLAAARDPERNPLTRLMRDYYEHSWPLLGSSRLPFRQGMRLVGIGGLLLALGILGNLIYELTR